MLKLSVILCTYNPVHNVLEKCLDNLIVASRSFPPFEILIIDNNSTHPVDDIPFVREFLRKFPIAKVVIEKKQGLTPARLRGITESNGELLLFVDDDNFVAGDFFERGAEIAETWSAIGAWSGQVSLMFEEQPPKWTKRYWGLLAYRKFTGNLWSNLPHLPETMPCGAGLFVRRSVADHYNHLHVTGKRSVQLDRSGKSLFSGGDNDLAACACDIGLGVGIFDSLHLDHMIPKSRTTKGYLIKLAEGIAHSGVVFRSFRGEMPAPMTMKRRLANNIRLLIKNSLEREFQRAVYNGEKQGRIAVRSLNQQA